MAIKPKLQSLLASANETTGQERDNLTDAVQDLVDGYGQGGAEEISYSTEQYKQKILLANGSAVDSYIQNAHYKLLNSDFTDFIYNISSAQSSARVIVKFKATDSTAFSYYQGVLGDSYTSEPGTRSCGWYLYPDGNVGAIQGRCAKSSGSINISYSGLQLNEWYYAVWYVDKINSACVMSIYDNNGNLLGVGFNTIDSFYNNASYFSRLGTFSSNNMLKGAISLSDTCYLIDEVAVWGKLTSKTANMGIYNFTNPASFTKVDWLESDGGQYIDTKILPQQNLQWNIKIGTNSNLDNFTVGWGSSGRAEACFVTVSNADYRYSFSGNYTSHIVPIAKDENLHIFSLKNGSQKFDGVEYSTDDTLRNTATAGQTIVLFAANWEWESPSIVGQKCHIGYSEMLLNNIPSQNLISVYHTETGILGMFDAVNNKFHMNAGTGDFTKPSDTSGEINLAEYLASLT